MEPREVASPPDDGGLGPNTTPADTMVVNGAEQPAGGPALHQDPSARSRPPRQRMVLPIIVALLLVLLVALLAIGPGW